MTITRTVPGENVRAALRAVDRGRLLRARDFRTLRAAGFVSGAIHGRYAAARLTEAGARVANGAPADPTASAVERYAEQLADHDAPESAPYARRLLEAELRAL